MLLCQNLFMSNDWHYNCPTLWWQFANIIFSFFYENAGFCLINTFYICLHGNIQLFVWCSKLNICWEDVKFCMIKSYSMGININNDFTWLISQDKHSLLIFNKINFLQNHEIIFNKFPVLLIRKIDEKLLKICHAVTGC